MDLNHIREKLIARGYQVTVCDTAADCAAYLDQAIDGTTVGIGGSVSVKELELADLLKTHNTIYWHNDPAQTAARPVKDILMDAREAAVYLSSVNAMTEDGVLINIDNTGNRIASTCYGHEKVYFIIGRNKIAPDYEQAMWRARNIASPKNAQRLKKQTPCAVKGDKCYDCGSPDRICNGFLFFERALRGMPTEIVLVNEDLGY